MVLIDTGYYGTGGSAGANSNVSVIDLIGNLIFSGITNASDSSGIAKNDTYGVQINAGNSIRVIGGKISNFGNNANLYADGSANICISSASVGSTGGPAAVLIEGVDLRPTYANVGGGSTGSAASQYGILVSATLTNGPVVVNGCNLSGFTHTGQLPVHVSGSVASETFYVTNCVGYNDKNTPINTLTNITTGTAYHAYNQAANSGTSYYGPSFIMFTASGTTGGTSVSINGNTAQTYPVNTVGCIFLNSPYDSIKFGVNAPAHFLWIGK